MFAPPVSVRVSARDQNALTFAAPSGTSVSEVGASAAPQQSSANALQSASNTPQTSKPIEISSELTLGSVSAAWALKNRAALVGTLRSVLALRTEDELVITAITAARRGRSLQAGGVKVEFSVGVSDPARAATSQTKLMQLASGAQEVVRSFAAQLDVELQVMI